MRVLEPYKVRIQTLPSFRDVLGGRVSTSQVRALAVEDLLDRAPVSFGPGPAARLIQGRRVLVTGAGGSIGSELSRQIAALAPSQLVLLDQYENGLHSLHLELSERGDPVAIDALVADVTDAERMHAVMIEYR